jgi:hypothetical protein
MPLIFVWLDDHIAAAFVASILCTKGRPTASEASVKHHHASSLNNMNGTQWHLLYNNHHQSNVPAFYQAFSACSMKPGRVFTCETMIAWLLLSFP